MRDEAARSSRSDGEQLPVPGPRYLFVGGLHRSGTSLLSRLVAAHPGIAAIAGAPVPEQEGVYLQGAIPHTARHGIPGEFAFDTAQHHIEGGAFDRADVRRRLIEDWDPWFMPGVPWRIEKSPVNLLRMRLYQQLFPLSQFIVVVRHPHAVAAATAKWSAANRDRLMRHWARAHDLALEDLAHLHRAMVIRYEDLVTRPGSVVAAIHTFLSLPPADGPAGEVVRDGNGDYAWPGPDASELRAAGPVAARLGYGPGRRPAAPLPRDLACRHPLRAVREAVLSRLAATSAAGRQDDLTAGTAA